MTPPDGPPTILDRRSFLRSAGAAALTVATPAAAVSGCSGRRERGRNGRVLRIGFVSPATGALADFAAADSFVIESLRRTLSAGVDRSGTRHPVEILVRDTGSDPKRAAAAADSLIKADRIHLMLTAETPETVNPVADRCEAAGIPCVSSLSPWQSWFFGRGGKAEQGFEWTYHYFFGLDEFIAVFLDMWDQLKTNKVVGALWPADTDDSTFRDATQGFPASLRQAGYGLVDPGPYPNLTTTDFRPQIEAFKDADVQILTGTPLPPDFNRFWVQAAQLGFRPRVVSVGKALMFPSSLEALGPLGRGLTVEVWWSPSHPFNSSLTGQSARQLADAYTRATKRQWTQHLGFVHSLFEVATDVLARASDISDRAAVRDAIASTNLHTIVGPVAWSGRPVRNVTTTKLVGGQWRTGGAFEYELTVVTNKALPQIPLRGQLEPLPGT